LLNLLYDAALVQSGFSMTDTDSFAKRIHRVVSLGLDVDPNAEVPQETEEETAASSGDADETEEAATEEPEGHDEL